MRRVSYTDSAGRLHHAWIREGLDAPHEGIPDDVPDISECGLPLAAEVALHNLLTAAGLTSWRDVMRQQSAVTEAVRQVARRFGVSDEMAGHVRRHVLSLYKARR